MKKIITIILAVIGVVSIILLGRVINTGDETIQSAAKAGDMGMVDSLFNPLATVAYIVLGVIIFLVIIFMLKGLFSNPANLKRTLMSVGAFALLLAICYFVFANGVETQMPDDKVLSANGSKWVGAGLYMFYALAIIAGGAMLFTGVKKMINNMAKRSAPEVNAGSMADIAFLLLIFFLVTTDIATDSGLNRKLPPIEETDPPIIKEKNIFQLSVNKNDQLLLKANGNDGDIIELKNLRQAAIDFLDNGGGKGEDACTFCQGKKNPQSSDNPDKAIISLQNDRATKYKTYISVQNELIAAYNALRNREYQRLYPNDGMNFVEANDMYNDPASTKKVRDKLKEKLEAVKLLVPQKLSEAEPKSN